MIRILMLLMMVKSCFIHAKDLLPKQYCISFGDSNAPIKIVEYFSYLCPQCIRIFKEDFDYLKKKYIETGKVYFIFHPDPSDLITIQAMICCSYFNEKRKQIFLERIFPELEGIGSYVATELLKKSLEVLSDLDKKQISMLNEESFIKKSKAFHDAYKFLLQKRFIKGVPTVEINGVIYEEFPTKKFLVKKIESLKEKNENN